MCKQFLDPDITRKGKLVENHLMRQVDDNKAPLFSVMEFNLTGLCNRKCVFCPRSNPRVFPNIDEHMPVSLYEKVMQDLQKVGFNGTIAFSGFGEPLLYKYIEEVIGLSRRYCLEAHIELITNGDSLTAKKLSKLFDAGLTLVSISMYDGPQQLEHFKALIKEAGLRDGQAVFRPRWLPPEKHFGINLTNRGGLWERKDLGVTTPKEPLKKSCYYPFYQTFVDYDGAVLLCTHDWGKKLIIGNVNKQSILEIWNNNILKEARLKLAKEDRSSPPCNLCNAQGTLLGRNHFSKWIEYYEKTDK